MKSVFTAAALAASVSGTNYVELENLLSYEEQSFMDQIDVALNAATELEDQVEEEFVALPEEEVVTLAEEDEIKNKHRSINLDCKEFGLKQCYNLCNSYPKGEVMECKATCYAKCNPKNSWVNPKYESGELVEGGRAAYVPNCGEKGNVKITIYNDKHCYVKNTHHTKMRQ